VWLWCRIERLTLVEPPVDPRGEALRGQDVAAARAVQAGGGVRQGVVEFGDGVGGDQHFKPVEDLDVVRGTPRVVRSGNRLLSRVS
jgi:hypothetical protein